jgi:methylmalonyl-CoA mutase C-terminal domain/subunit
MPQDERRIRVLIGKVGFDPHDRGIRVLIHGLRDAGMEVIYTGKFQTAAAVVSAAIHEDVDVLALSDHCGVLPDIATDVVGLLKEQGVENIAIVAGGVLTEEDRVALEKMGVTGNFGAGTPMEMIVDHIRMRAERKGTPRQLPAAGGKL